MRSKGCICDNVVELAVNKYAAVVKNELEWWIGWIEEVPGMNCQERTREELMESLGVSLKEALEFNRVEGLAAAGKEYREEKIAVSGRPATGRHSRKLSPRRMKVPAPAQVPFAG